MSAWDYRRYGTVVDPIHQSHLNSITGDYGCPKQFRYQMDARAVAGSDIDSTVSGKTACGTAAHETIARALSNPDSCRALLSGRSVSALQVGKAFNEEFERETQGREVQWYRHKADKCRYESAAMVFGVLNDMHKHVAEVVLVEPAFIVQCGGYWLSGHMDLIYRPRAAPRQLAISDWKTTAAKPCEIELDHSWQAGVYSAALQSGIFLPRQALQVTHHEGGYVACVPGMPVPAVRRVSRYVAERDALESALIHVGASGEWFEQLQTFGEFPAEVHYVALQDYVPYQRAGSKPLTRREDMAWRGGETTYKYKKGDQRGPAWLPIRITEHDVPRLQSRLRNVVGMIRMGRFIDQVGEKCRRCHWADDCLNSGYAAQGDEKKQLERQLKLLGTADTDAAELSLD